MVGGEDRPLEAHLPADLHRPEKLLQDPLHDAQSRAGHILPGRIDLGRLHQQQMDSLLELGPTARRLQ
jgi:hypothetical protein